MGNVPKDRTIDYSMAAIEGITKIDGGDVVSMGSALIEGLRPDSSIVRYREFLEDFACSLAYTYCTGLDDIAFMKLEASTGESMVWSQR